MIDERGGKDVASVEETEMRSNIGSIYEIDDSVSGFHASTCSGDNFYDIYLRMRKKLLLRIQFFCFNTNKKGW